MEKVTNLNYNDEMWSQMEAPIPDVNPAEVDVVLPDPEPHGEDGRLGLRALLLVRYAVGAQLGPPSSPVARLKKRKADMI